MSTAEYAPASVRVLDAPAVRLVGRQEIDRAALGDFLEAEGVEGWTTDAREAGQELVEVAGRLCYKSYARPRPGGNAKYLEHILEVGHGSVIEHAVFNLIITGISRSLSHELVRHRAGWAYSQRSQRFCDESDLAVVVPPGLAREVALGRALVAARGQDAGFLIASGAVAVGTPEWAGLRWLAAQERARDAYADLSDYLLRREIGDAYPQDGVRTPAEARAWVARRFRDGSGAIATAFRKAAREAARSVLPNAAETQVFVTANARALRHFIEARGDRHADREIRAVALALLRVLRDEAPDLFGDYRVEGEGADAAVVARFRKV